MSYFGKTDPPMQCHSKIELIIWDLKSDLKENVFGFVCFVSLILVFDMKYVLFCGDSPINAMPSKGGAEIQAEIQNLIKN